MTPGGDITQDDKTPGLLGSSNVLFNNPWTFLASGSTGDRPVPTPANDYRLRFNTTLKVYEYYDPNTSTWTQLSGTGTGTVNPGVADDIAFYAANGQAVSPIAGAPNSVLITNGAKTPSLSTTLPSGLSIPGAAISASTAALLSGTIVATPANATDIANKAYVDTLVSAGVSTIVGTTNQVFANGVAGVPQHGAVTLSTPQDIAVGSTPTFAGMTLSSIPLNNSSGGTGVASVTTTPTATAFAGWDASLNMRANNFIGNFTTNASSAGTTTLTVASSETQEITGTLAQIMVMPVTSTLRAGHSFKIINNSSGVLTVNSSGGNAIVVMAANTTSFLSCVLNSGTTAASWNASYIFDNGSNVLSITGTANQVIASSSTGAITLSLPQDIATTSAVQFGTVRLNSNLILGSLGTTVIQTVNPASSVNFIGVNSSVAASPVIIQALGSDTNILNQISGKGTSGAGIQGKTSGANAAAGNIGEVVSSQVLLTSAVALTTNTAMVITSMSVTAGDWDITGNIVITGGNTTNIGTIIGYATTTLSASLPDPSLRAASFVGNTINAAGNIGLVVPTIRVNVTTTTTVYLYMYTNFTVSTAAGCGGLIARRV